MNLSPLAGKPAPPRLLVDVSRPITAYFTDTPEPGELYLRRILNEAQAFVRETVDASRRPLSPPPHEQTEREAVEAWENEGDPN